MKKMLQNTMMSLGVVSIFFACTNSNNKRQIITEINNTKTKDSISIHIDSNLTTTHNLKEVKFSENNIIEKMAYADTANFIHQKIYGCAKCYLVPAASDSLLSANKAANKIGYNLVIYDCYRPKKYQAIMYKIVNNPAFVANPSKGSNHNKGCAIDISLADKNGNELDMGTAFDDFTEKAHFQSSSISNEAKQNRILLRNIMTKAGFTAYDNEWWHFNFVKKEYPISNFEWNCSE